MFPSETLNMDGELCVIPSLTDYVFPHTYI